MPQAHSHRDDPQVPDFDDSVPLAVIHLGQLPGGRRRIADIPRILPGSARGRLCLRVARNRYTLFGRADMCAIPDPAFRGRLLL